MATGGTAEDAEYVSRHREEWERVMTEAIGAAISTKATEPLRLLSQHCEAAAARQTGAEQDRLDLAAVLGGCETASQREEGSVAVEWSVSTWLEGLGVAKTLATSLLRSVREQKPGTDELSFVRSLGRVGSKAVVVSMLNAYIGSLVDELATSILEGAKGLVAAGAATGSELHGKFASDGSAFTMSYGGLDTFFGGLEGLIGTPNPRLRETMEREHCASTDSDREFTANNYGTSTTSSIEWRFVVDPDSHDAESWPQESRLRADPALHGQCRAARSVRHFAPDLERINAQLQAQDCSAVCDEEFWGARLYTGPMFIKYNALLRGLGSKAPFFLSRLDELCGAGPERNTYTTTLHVINSACVKLSKVMTAQKVYRGVAGGILPDEFWSRNAWNVAGGVEFAFTSTTLNQEVALHYASSGGAGLVFEIQMGMVDRGADLSWLSQYPHEKEILFAPLTGFEVQSTRVEGGVIVVETRLSVNLTALTIEQVVSRRRKLCTDMCDSMQLELHHEVSTDPWRELRDLAESVGFDLPAYARGVLRHDLESCTSHPPEHYNVDGRFLNSLKEAVDAKTATSGLPRGWRKFIANATAGAASEAKRGASKKGGDEEFVSKSAFDAADTLVADCVVISSKDKQELCADGAAALSVFLALSPAVLKLDCSGQKLMPDGAAHLGRALGTNRSLTRVDLSNNMLCGIDDAEERRFYKPKGIIAFSKGIKANSTITSLDLSMNYLWEAGTMAIAVALLSNTTLIELKLGDSCPGMNGWKALAKLVVTNRTLRLLDLDCCTEGGMKVNELATAAVVFGLAAAQSNLATLGLSCCEFKAGSERIVDAASSPHLTDLNLSGAELGAKGGVALGAALLKTDSSMVKLDVSSNDMRAGGASVCEAIGGMKRLAELDISSNELNEHGMAALGVAIGASASLATVDASGNHARKAGVAVGEGIARSASLTELNISDSKLGGEGGVGLLRGVAANASLTKLDIGSNKLGAEGGEALGDALAANGVLRELVMWECKMGPEAGSHLARGLAKNCALTELDLTNNDLRGSVAALGAALIENTSLKKLELNENRAGDAAAATLADGLGSNRALTILHLDECELGAGAGLALAKALQANGVLTELSFSNNNVGADSMCAIASALANNRALTQLDVADVHADESVALAFAAALTPASTPADGNVHMRDLDLQYNILGAQGEHALQEAFRQRAAALKPLAGTLEHIASDTQWIIKTGGDSGVTKRYLGLASERPQPPPAASQVKLSATAHGEDTRTAPRSE